MRMVRCVEVVAAAGLVVLAGVSCTKDREGLRGERGLSESVSRRVTVTEDLTVFTLFALLNAAGYDDEHLPQMHPVRVRVRNALAAKLDPALRQRLRAFYDAHRGHADPWAYSVVAKATSGPPAFTPTPDWNDIQKNERFGSLDDLHDLMPMFYAAADVPGLYDGVRIDYVEYVRAYEMEIRRQVVAVLNYCRVRDVEALGAAPPGERSEALVIPNLLDSYEHAFSFELGGRFISIEGPQPKIGYNPHEFVHAVTNPAVYSAATRALDARLQPLVDEASKALGGDAAFGSAEAFVDECLVRAISLRYLAGERCERRATLVKTMNDEYRSGYILERFFWDQLERYEASSADLRTFYPVILASLDPEAELARWREAHGRAATPAAAR